LVRPIGIAPDFGSDLIVALQPILDKEPLQPFTEAMVLMHEMGHTLGLGHGGIRSDGTPDHTNYKPNHLSIMNYAFGRGKEKGLIIDGHAGLLDYSHFGQDAIPNLNENNLNETTGLGDNGAISAYGTRWFCGKGDESGRTTFDANGAIDWDCDGNDNETSVTANINADTSNIPLVCPNKREELITRNEWGNLQFKNGTIGTYTAVIPEYPVEFQPEAPDPDLPEEVVLEWNYLFLPINLNP
jgi:hypothetical protein